jgi:hypothetical protein
VCGWRGWRGGSWCRGRGTVEARGEATREGGVELERVDAATAFMGTAR